MGFFLKKKKLDEGQSRKPFYKRVSLSARLALARLFKSKIKKTIATGVVIEQAGKVLLIRKSRGPYMGQFWCVPGGKPNPNEPLMDCAAREIKEETGLDIKISHEVLRHSHVTIANERIVNFDFTDFAAHPIGGTLKPTDDAVEARWVSKEELQKLRLSPPTKKLLKKSGFLNE